MIEPMANKGLHLAAAPRLQVRPSVGLREER